MTGRSTEHRVTDSKKYKSRINEMKLLRNIPRILTGLVFIFSGFVKGVDPLGTVYRMNDYFQVFGMPWAEQFSLILTFFLCALEFTLGISLLFNLWLRFMAWPLLFVMIYFTVVTFFDATLNMVPDCGCFGDALKLTNLQTFLKNVVLLGFIIVIFIYRKKYKAVIPARMEILVLLIFAGAFLGMSIHSYRHLPLIDFMSWKVGNRINQKSTEPVKYYLTFENRKTGQAKEYLSPNYPWNDSVWMAEWKFVSQRVDDPNASAGVALLVDDEQGNNVTANIIDNHDYQFIFVAYDLAETNREAFIKVLPFYKKAIADGHSFVCLTSSLYPDIRQFKIANGVLFDFYTADDVVLKTMVRSNPGLILIRDGVVLGKWHYNDLPEYEVAIDSLRSQ
jgi:uncharacterized membrane protein YphA (DoxX/SURF4 family)